MEPATPGTIVIARVSCRPDKREQAIEMLTKLQDASRAEDGCLNYGFSVAIEDENAFIAVEEWADLAALQTHLREAHIAEFMAGLGDVIAGPPHLAMHTVSETGPLPLGG